MKKRMIILLACLLILALVAVVVFIQWQFGAFVFDHSADVGSDHVIWNGKNYAPVSGEYTEGRTLAKSMDGNWSINAVEEDPSHRFVVARSFLDQYLMVSDDYKVPVSGKLTTVSWNGEYITDPIFLNAIAALEVEKTTSFTYETPGIFQLTDHQHMYQVYVAYEDCPVTTNYLGYMGKVNGQWVITTHIAEDTTYPEPYAVSCYSIPDEYHDILSKYFS